MTDDFVSCCNCAADIDWPGTPLEDAVDRDDPSLDLQLPTDCEDVLVMRGDMPVVTETWCNRCVAGARLRGTYQFEGRETFGRRYERGAQPLRVRKVSEDLRD